MLLREEFDFLSLFKIHSIVGSNENLVANRREIAYEGPSLEGTAT
jgi:hypothetical protein